MTEFTSPDTPSSAVLRFCDIGVNYTDDMFKGIYRGKKKHPEDLLRVLERAQNVGVQKSIVTGCALNESMEALDLCRKMPDWGMYCTVGVHPCQANDILGKEDEYIESLKALIRDGVSDGKVVAIGECGLDYDRLEWATRENQLPCFHKQLDMAEELEIKLPFFLHNRNTNGEFISILRENRHKLAKGGVVHTFDGTSEDLHELLDLGFHIGINGCSMKGEENLKVVAEIPEDKLLLETDAPWCGIKNSHAGSGFIKTKFETKKVEKYQDGLMVKDRNEPCTMVQVLEVVAAVREADPVALAEKVWQNTEDLFFPDSSNS